MKSEGHEAWYTNPLIGTACIIVLPVLVTFSTLTAGICFKNQEVSMTTGTIHVYLDMDGKSIKRGDRVIYGKSNRDNPIGVGEVIEIEEGFIHIMAEGGKKPSQIGGSRSHRRIMVIPKK